MGYGKTKTTYPAAMMAMRVAVGGDYEKHHRLVMAIMAAFATRYPFPEDDASPRGLP